MTASALIQDYLKSGVLETAAPSNSSIATHVASATSALEVAKLAIPGHHLQAIGLLYDSALGLALAYLQARGLRITSRAGHHTAALEVLAEEVLAGKPALVSPLFELKRARTEVTYGVDAPGYTKEEANTWLNYVSGLMTVVTRRIEGRILPYRTS